MAVALTTGLEGWSLSGFSVLFLEKTIGDFLLFRAEADRSVRAERLKAHARKWLQIQRQMLSEARAGKGQSVAAGCFHAPNYQDLDGGRDLAADST